MALEEALHFLTDLQQQTKKIQPLNPKYECSTRATANRGTALVIINANAKHLAELALQ
jgi:hypothetical protein